MGGMLHRRRALTGLCAALGAVVTVAGCETLATAARNQTAQTFLEVSGNSLILNGEINRQTLRQFTRIADGNPDLTTLVLVNVPGSIDDRATLMLGREVRARGMGTQLIYRSEIASGAVDLFLAGTERTMQRGARIGVHSWQDGFGQGRDLARDHPEHDQYVNYMLDMIGREDFYWFTLAASPADDIHWMSAAEINQYGLLTSPVIDG